MDFMRTSLATIIGLATLAVSGAVQAAELPVSSPVVVATPVWNWAGFYIGGEVGGKWMDNPWTATSLRDPPGPLLGGVQLPVDGTSPRNYDGESVRLGGYLGYNWQFSRLWLVGLEADVAWTDSHNKPHPGFPGCSPPGASGCVAGFTYDPGAPFGGDTTSLNMRWDASARGRIGFLATPRHIALRNGRCCLATYRSHRELWPLANFILL